MQPWAIVLLNLIGMGFLLTQNRFSILAGTEGNIMWAAFMVGALLVGAVVAGIWHLVRKTSKQQTMRHFLMVSWVMAALLTIGTFK